MKEILCIHCQEAIHERDDLVVAGKLMQPHHVRCFEQVKHGLPYLMAYPLNSLAFWIFLVAVNLVFVGVSQAFPGTGKDMLLFALVVNIPLLLFRGLCWLSYERHLP